MKKFFLLPILFVFCFTSFAWGQSTKKNTIKLREEDGSPTRVISAIIVDNGTCDSVYKDGGFDTTSWKVLNVWENDIIKIPKITDINFAGSVAVTDEGSGKAKVTVIGGGGPSTYPDILKDNASIVDNCTMINFEGGISVTPGELEKANIVVHDKLHTLNSTENHTGIGGFEDEFMALDENGLPKSSGKIASDFSASDHNHSLNNLVEKSYNSLTDKPTISNMRSHALDNATLHTGVVGATEDNIMVFDNNTLPKDGGSKISDLATASGLSDHTDNRTIHFPINDSGTELDEAWSANKISSDLSGKSDTGHNHALASLSEKSYDSLTDKPEIPEGMRKHGIDNSTMHDGVSEAVENNFMSFDSNGLPKDSGDNASDFSASDHNHALNNLSEKSYDSLTDKPEISNMRQHALDNATLHSGISGTEDNFMSIDNAGFPKDSGKKASDFADASDFAEHADNTTIHGPYNSTDIADNSTIGGPMVYDSLNAAAEAFAGFEETINNHIDNATPHTRIDDLSEVSDKTWSSEKIQDQIDASGGGVMYQHGIDNDTVHAGVAGAILDNFLSFDTNGLPKDSGKNAGSFLDNSTITALGKVLYIDVSRTEDYMATGSIILPYHTVREANDYIGTLSPPESYGWTVVIMPGVYTEKIHCKTYTNYIGQPVDRGMLSETTLFGNIRFDADTVNAVTISGFCTGMAISGLTESFFLGSSADNIVISDCAIHMSASATTPAIKFDGGSFNVGVIQNCSFTLADSESTIPSVIELDAEGTGGFMVLESTIEVPAVENAIGINIRNTSASITVDKCLITRGDPAINLDNASSPNITDNNFISPWGTGIRIANDPSGSLGRIFGNMFNGSNTDATEGKGGIVIDADSRLDIVSNKFWGTRKAGIHILSNGTDVDGIFIRDNAFYYFWGNENWHYIKDDHEGTGEVNASGNIFEVLPTVTGTTPDGHPQISTNVAWVPYQTLDASASAIYDNSTMAEDHGGFSIADALDYTKEHIDNGTIHTSQTEKDIITNHIDNATIHSTTLVYIAYDNATGEIVPDNATLILVDTETPDSNIHVILPDADSSFRLHPITVKHAVVAHDIRISVVAGGLLEFIEDAEYIITGAGKDAVTFTPYYIPAEGENPEVRAWWITSKYTE
jgi:hypothetical protein